LGRTRLTLSGNVASIVQNDRLVGLTSGATSNVFTIDSGNIFTVANNSYIDGERVDIRTSLDVSKGLTSLVTASQTAKGTISFYKDVDGEVIADMEDSSGFFSYL
jgi:hypothetical protein